jgi:hypothetical protein
MVQDCGMVKYSNILLCPRLHGGIPAISGEPQTSTQAWKLIEVDYSLRLYLVADDWATKHRRAWNEAFAEGRKRGNAAYCGPALVEMEIADADKRAEWAYQTCCEIWEIQGRAKCRLFFRAIFDSCLQPMFSVRESCFKHELELHQKRTRTGIPQGLSAIGGHMNRKMGKLRAKWNTKLEIAARDLENQARVEQQRELEEKGRAIRELRERRFFEETYRPKQAVTIDSGRLPAGQASSAFTWKELEGRFHQVQARTTPRQNLHAIFIRTEWDSGSVGEEWTVGGNLALRKEFEYLGTIGSRKLGFPPSHCPHEDWLDRVRAWMEQTGLDKDRDYAWQTTGSVNEKGAFGTTETLSSDKIAELSAKFCMHLMANGTPETAGSQLSQSPIIADRQTPPRRSVQKARKTPKQLKRMAVIFGAIQSELKGQKYCATLDTRGIRPPDRWKEDGCPDTYQQAYKDEQWRKRIQDEKCRYREQYDKTPKHEREAIIQGESDTRHARHGRVKVNGVTPE